MIGFASGVSTEPGVLAALIDLLEQTRGVADPDLVLLFTSGGHNLQLRALSKELRSSFGAATVLGAAGAGVIGRGREIEGETAVSVVLASLPGVSLHPFVRRSDEEPWSAERWAGIDAERGLILVADPYSVDIGAELPTLQRAKPGVPVVGGLGSAESDLLQPRLVLDGEQYDDGAIGLGLSGDLRITTVVAQGCRPVGPPMFVTACERNRILEIDGRSAVAVLRDLYESLGPIDRSLFGRSLFVGVQMRDQTEYVPGDFLIRNVVGIAADPPALVVGYLPERFQVVQMHVRDEGAAREDIAEVLHATDADPRGALLVSCVGRGAGLFGESGHDSARFADRFGDVPLGGFFANGEIGPVQGRAYVHGYTSVFALFEDPPETSDNNPTT